MANGICDVRDCQRQTYLGWRPLSEPRGRQICEYHIKRHRDENEKFILFDEFGFNRRPVKDRANTAPQENKCSGCDKKIQPECRFCEDCAQKRKRHSKREYQQRKRDEKKKPLTDEWPDKNIRLCSLCGNEREPGHTYCEKCALRQKRKNTRERLKQFRNKIG